MLQPSVVWVPEAGLSSNPGTHLLVFGRVISPWLPGSDGWRAAWHQRSLCWEPLAVGTKTASSQHGWRPWWEGSWVQTHCRLDWDNYWVSLCLSIHGQPQIICVSAHAQLLIHPATNNTRTLLLQAIHTSCFCWHPPQTTSSYCS